MLRYHRKSQLARRLVGPIRRRLQRITGGRRYLRLPASLPGLRENPGWQLLQQCKLDERRAHGSAARAAEILAGRFCFLHQDHSLPDPIDWRLESWPEVPHLWRFHLHYHEFLLDLAAEGTDRGERAWFDRAWQLVAAWIENNPLADARVLTDAWHPYCISRRLPVWMLLWSASALAPAGELSGELSGELAERVVGSMFSQANYLQGNLERDIGGNHLLENARALTMIGSFLAGPDADRWLGAGENILRAELPEQILPHGEHYERSPMYHALMLELALDVRDATAAVRPDLSEFCAAKAAQMAGFLEQILHPDGEIPLLGDSFFGEAAPIAQTMARAARPDTQKDLPDRKQNDMAGRSPLAQTVGDYWIYRDGGDFLLFDAGPVGLDYLPAHAHADLLSWEASIQGRRLLVDSGTFNYQADEMRRYCRGSSAHNVLMIDDRDQCDMWSRFRMGYRGWPSGIETGETDGFHWARAEHNAYRRLGVPTVGRWIACRRGGPWFCVDWAGGTGHHKLTSRLHLHPDVQAEQVAPDKIRLVCGEVVLHLQPLAPGSLRVAKGWYCPELGRRLPCPVAEWSVQASLPSVCGWCLAWDESEVAATLDRSDPPHVVLSWVDGGKTRQMLPVENT